MDIWIGWNILETQVNPLDIAPEIQELQENITFCYFHIVIDTANLYGAHVDTLGNDGLVKVC